jgi:DNA-binding PadR family transcriptional regulator
MPFRPKFSGPRPGRVLGLYALATMERDGPVYGYLLGERVAERTDGAWRPGAGAVYPALGVLVERGWARRLSGGRRRLYSITPAGRTALARIRSDWMGGGSAGPDLSRIWAEIAGSGDAGQHLLRHLRRHLDDLGARLEREPELRAGQGSLREQVLGELRASEARLSALASPRATIARRRRTG